LRAILPCEALTTFDYLVEPDMRKTPNRVASTLHGHGHGNWTVVRQTVAVVLVRPPVIPYG
jgi:hypothetical protein